MARTPARPRSAPRRSPRQAPRPAPRRRRTPGEAFERLVAIMAALRGPRGCAWDRRQTHQSLRGHLLEESFEAADAIDRNDLDALPGELGDVLLQCVFHAQLGRETRRFDITTVVDAIAGKLIRRHPHVFAADGRLLTKREQAQYEASTPDAVREQWARLKAAEQAGAGREPRVLAGIPRALPALLRAHKIGGRAASVGFDWPKAHDILAKIDEEVAELRGALDESPARAREEMGDLLFSIANLARRLGIDAEAALSAANDKFTRRFDAVEATLEAQGRSVHVASLEELEAAWQQVKSAPPARASSSRSSSARSPRARRTRSSPRRPDRS